MTLLRFMRLCVFCALVLILLSGFLSRHLRAQSVHTIRGYIVDPTGAGVPAAAIELESKTGAVVRKTQSGNIGGFAFSGIPAGAYVVSVPAFSQFAATAVPIKLTADIADVKVVLSLATVNENVTVPAEGSLSTDPSANQDTVAISGNQLRRLPAIDLDYVSALSSFLDASSETSGGMTLVVDGIEMKSVGVSPSAIQEVRINNDPYAAEFNRPGRGRIEVITKPGSQQYHGEFNFLARNAVFNARNYFALTREPENRLLFEGHFTGPVGHAKRTNFIASGEYGRRDTYSTVNAIGINGAINQNVPTPHRNSQASLRVTHDFSPTHRLQVGYNFEYGTDWNSGVGGLVLPEAGSNDQSREDDLIFNDRILIGANVVNQLLVTMEKDEDVMQSTTKAQSVHVNGAFTGGGAQSDRSATENTIHVNEIVSWSKGRHYIRFGVQLPQFSRRAVDDHTDRLGTFSFASLADYESNSPYVFTAQQGIGRGLYWINEFGAFFQDQIRVSDKLQATVGLRYDWQTFLDDRNNLAPRLSVAYAPHRGVVVRAGFGVFYDRTGGDFPATVILHNGSILDSVQLQNPGFPLTTGSFFTAAPSNIVRFAPGVRTPYILQSSIGIEKQVTKKLTIAGDYRNLVQVKSFRSRDANAPILPPDPSLSADYPRPNSAFGEIQQIESGARGIFNAFDLSIHGEIGPWFSGQVQYTLSRAENNTGGISRFPQNQYQPNNEWGRANNDRLQALNLAGEINPDHWLSLGINAGLYSGTPYTETTGNDDYHTGLGNARPAGVGRNTLQGAGQINLDLSWQHDFHLGKIRGDEGKFLTTGVSAFNVLNHTNFTGYIGALTSPLFTHPTSSLNGRQMQFAIGYTF